MPIKTKTGDVFLILTDKGYGLGQIVAKYKSELYVLIYDFLSQKENILPEEVLSQKPLFAALSFDAKIWHGDWPIIGNITKNLDIIPQPNYKVGYKGDVYFESRDRSVFRIASDEEIPKLRYRNLVAPIRLEKALKAYHGMGVWHPRYDELLFDYALMSSQLAQPSNSTKH